MIKKSKKMSQRQKRLKHIIQVLDSFDPVLNMISWICIIIPIAMIICLGMVGIFIDANSQGKGLDFWWQFIGFDFVLAALLLNILQHELLNKIQKRIVPFMAFIFIIAGISMILSYGFLAVGIHEKIMWVSTVGTIFFFVPLFLMSLGMAAMFVECFRQIFAVIVQKEVNR